MAKLTISDAARRCGIPRSTLQRAIRAGRLHLDPTHRLDLEELVHAGYLAAPGALQQHAPVARQSRQRVPQDLALLLRDMQRSMERLTETLRIIAHEVQQMRQERCMEQNVTKAKERSGTRPQRSMERDTLSTQQALPLQPRAMAPAAIAPPLDPTKYVLGRLCPRGHDYADTGQTLWRMPGYHCRQCEAALAKERRGAKRERRP